MAVKTILTPEWITWGKKQMRNFPNLEGFVAGEGGLKPRAILIGEAPGAREIELGHPFMGPAGLELDRMLSSVGLTRADIYITSPVSSRPFKIGKTNRKSDRKPTQAEIKAFAPMLDYELSALPKTLLVPMGNTGLQRLLGTNAKIGKLHGQLMRRSIRKLNRQTNEFELTVDHYDIFPIYHPSYSKRFKSMKPVVDHDMQELQLLLKK